jgi:RND family efflux transporter MFP subunit
MLRLWLALLGIVVLTALLAGCSSGSTPTAAAASAPVAADADHGSASASSQPLNPSRANAPNAPVEYIASGPIVVENQVDLAAQRDGLVAEILVDAGAPVKKGQLLAKLDDRQLTAERDAAAAKVRSVDADLKNWEAGANASKAERDRAEAMWEAHIIAKEQEEKAKYQYEATVFEVQRQAEDLKVVQSTLQALQLELEKTRITAPFDGVVARRYVRAGQQVAKNDRLFWVSAVAPLRVKFSLPEGYLGRVHRGTELVIVAPLGSGTMHRARVVMVSPVVDPSSDTIDVTAEVEDRSANLRPGMTANVRFPDAQ